MSILLWRAFLALSIMFLRSVSDRSFEIRAGCVGVSEPTLDDSRLLVGPVGLLLPSFQLALLGPSFIPEVSWGPLSFFKSSGETVPGLFESPFSFKEGGTFDLGP